MIIQQELLNLLLWHLGLWWLLTISIGATTGYFLLNFYRQSTDTWSKHGTLIGSLLTILLLMWSIIQTVDFLVAPYYNVALIQGGMM